jgi:hypothetical protein
MPPSPSRSKDKTRGYKMFEYVVCVIDSSICYESHSRNQYEAMPDDESFIFSATSVKFQRTTRRHIPEMEVFINTVVRASGPKKGNDVFGNTVGTLLLSLGSELSYNIVGGLHVIEHSG